MRDLLAFLTAVVVLMIVQTLSATLAVAAGVFALMCAVAFPKRTFQLVGAIGLLTVAAREPAGCVAALGAVGVAAAVAGRLCRSPEPISQPPVALPKPPILTLTDERAE